MRSYLWGIVLVGLFFFLPGCNIIGAIAYMTAPPQMKDAEIELTTGRLVLFIEYANSSEENPVFTRAFRERLIEIFREQEVNDQIVPPEEILRLRQVKADFSRWSLQKIGRELDAEQVLYVRIERLRMQASADALLLTPEVRLQMKVIAPRASPREARLWPGP
ncbi:MAG: hypothetical protein KAY37_05435, partial [Phycisphaerae bacterium]|nr:hypothetical protein [Phycisphaerae bacterium]